MLQEAYCANEGCIAVFVERGKLNALSPQVQSKDADTGRVSHYIQSIFLCQ